ncbi:MAG: YbjQ family protein [Verrucomicrobiae bacterium]|nr:YbjQ family protein [Verrucomicrobiae bacterium]
MSSHTHPLTTTAFELPGYRVVRSLGVVRGIVVRSRSIVGNMAASLQTLIGGNISVYTSLCERARAEAFQQMLAHAGELGANAVIGVRYDATEIGPGVTEVLCYGTAVHVESVTPAPPPAGESYKA